MDHSTCRSRVCLLCLRKSTCDLRKLSVLIPTIHLYFIQGYTTDDQRLPHGICTSCKRKLYFLTNGDFSRTFTSTGHVEELLSSRFSPRATDCDCRICYVAKCKGWKAKALLKAIKSKPATSTPAPKTFTICATCFGQVAEGTTHACSRRQVVNNICQLVPSETQERIASRVLAEKTTHSRNGPISLKTGGRFRTVSK